MPGASAPHAAFVLLHNVCAATPGVQYRKCTVLAIYPFCEGTLHEACEQCRNVLAIYGLPVNTIMSIKHLAFVSMTVFKHMPRVKPCMHVLWSYSHCGECGLNHRMA